MSRLPPVRTAPLTLLLWLAACQPGADPVGIVRPSTVPGAPAADTDPNETCASGGYFTRLTVDPATSEAGDGRHFTRITDALAAARSGRIARSETTAASAACRITITVAPGTFRGGFGVSATSEVFPLVLDVPRLTLEGGLRMVLDASGRATGATVDPSQVTVLEPASPLTGQQTLIVVTDSSNGLTGLGDATRGDSVTVRGLELRSGYAAPDSTSGGGGFGIFAIRVQGLVVEDVRFGFLLAAAFDGRGLDARLEHIAAADLGGSCALCLAGPGQYAVSGSRIERSGLVGVLVIPASTAPMPSGVRPLTIASAPTVVSAIDNNYIAGEQQHPVGTAIRVLAIGQGVATMVGQRATAQVTSNELVGNRFGLIADGGFPPKNTSTSFPSGNVTLRLGGNQFAGNCQADMLVALARHTRALGLPTGNANAGYLKQSLYDVSLAGDLSWNQVWFSHPASDNGVTLNNVLQVDGVPIPNGDRTAYNGAECGFTPSAAAWIGLKNSDDVGTKFDLLTEIRRNGILVAAGQLDGVKGGSSGFNNAVERSIVMTLSGSPAARAGDTLSVTISARIAVGVAGHSSGTARLWYGNAAASSRITTLTDTLSRTYYLSDGYSLNDAPGAGTARYLDLLLKKNVGGNPFKPFGTWTKVF